MTELRAGGSTVYHTKIQNVNNIFNLTLRIKEVFPYGIYS